MEEIYRNIHQEVIDRCKKQDRQAQFQLYKLYYKMMYNVSLQIVGDQMEAEDIMQEAFLSALLKIETYEGKVSFGAWLKRIVVNRSLDCLKKRKVYFEEIDEKIPIADEPLILEVEEDYVEVIKEAIGELPDKYRIVLNLFLIEGYSHEGIAVALNISNETSRIQFFRAKQKLKEILMQKSLVNESKY